MKFATLRVFLFVLAVATFLSVPAMAQYTPGSVSGTVTDPMGAVVPGATVELIDPSTGFVRTQETTDDGRFLFDRVASRTYTLRVSKQGFRTTELKEVVVTTGKITALGELRLEVGATGEVVTVEAAAAPLVQAESAQITGNYTGRQVTDTVFGLLGLDATAFLTPGVVPGIGTGFNNSNTGFGSTGTSGFTGVAGGGDIGVNGLRSRSNNFTFDGQSINDISLGGPGLFLSNLDTVQEYQITTNQFNADQGRAAAATINTVTKSGTNDAHGSVFWFNESSRLWAVNAQESREDIHKPSFFLDNVGGFTLGGPVVKSKLFAFGSFYVERQPGTTFLRTTLANGAITDNGVATLQAAFPASGTIDFLAANGPLQRPFGNPTCIASETKLITFAGVPGVEVCNFTRTRPNNFEEEEFTGRIDWVGKKHGFWGRYFFEDNAACCFFAGSSGYNVNVPARSQALGLTHTYQLSPRMLNEFRFNYTRLFVVFAGGEMNAFDQHSQDQAFIDMPTGFLDFGVVSGFPQGRIVNEFQFQDNWSLVRGRHTIKAGVDIRRIRTAQLFLPFDNGIFAYNNQTRFANNQPTSLTFNAGEFTFHIFETDQFYYVQDDIRLNNFLGGDVTLNLGMRYEHSGQPGNVYNDATLARESNPATALWSLAVPLNERIYPFTKNDNNNWAPRIGFAYTPHWWKGLFGENKTVIRGGYGISYDLNFYNILVNIQQLAPVSLLRSLSCSAAGSCPPLPGTGTLAEVQAAITPTVVGTDPRRASWSPAGQFVDRDTLEYLNPYAQNWSLGIQREIGRSAVFEARYVGTSGVKLWADIFTNPHVGLFRDPSTFNLTEVLAGRVPQSNLSLSSLFAGCANGQLAVFDFGTGTDACVTVPAQPQFIPTGTAECTDATAVGFGSTDCGFVAGRMIPRTNAGKSQYHALQTRFDFRNWRNQVTGGVSWTWSKALDNVSEIFADLGTVEVPENPFDTRRERALSNYDRRHTVTANVIWDLPWQRDQKGWLGKVAGGWQVNGFALFYTGAPWTPDQALSGGLSSGGIFGTEIFGTQNPFCAHSPRRSDECRPHISNANAPLNTVGIFLLENGTPTLFDFSDLSPTTLDQVHWVMNNWEAVMAGFPIFGANRNLSSTTGDGTHAINLGIFKNTYVGKENQVNIQFRFQMVNAFNHRNFGLQSDDFPENAGFGFGDFTGNDAIGRRIRFGLRVVF